MIINFDNNYVYTVLYLYILCRSHVPRENYMVQETVLYWYITDMYMYMHMNGI